jgi:branched-chain amino acid transport system ATP-binding protein
MSTMLSLDKVEVYYGNIRALKDISLTVDEGEFVTIIGANGAGKSTTLLSIAGGATVSGGRMLLLGNDITRRTSEYRVKNGIALVPEGRRIFPDLTVYENMEIGAYCRSDSGEIKKDIDKYFAMFPILGERRNQSAGDLSGGEQQMLAISRALMGRPKLLLLDEPSLGLAPMLIEEVFNTIAELNAHGSTILLVEQNARKALSFAHRGYVLETGQIVLEGTADELLKNPKIVDAYLGGGLS